MFIFLQLTLPPFIPELSVLTPPKLTDFKINLFRNVFALVHPETSQAHELGSVYVICPGGHKRSTPSNEHLLS